MELPAVFLEEMIEAYPEATFIHVERDLDKWYKSIMSTLGHSLVACEQYPLKQLRWVDSYIDKFCSFHLTVQRVWWHGMPIDQGEAALKGDYTDLSVTSFPNLLLEMSYFSSRVVQLTLFYWILQ